VLKRTKVLHAVVSVVVVLVVNVSSLSKLAVRLFIVVLSGVDRGAGTVLVHHRHHWASAILSGTLEWSVDLLAVLGSACLSGGLLLCGLLLCHN